MHPLPPPLCSEPRVQNKFGERSADQRKTRVFHDLLDVLPEPLVVENATRDAQFSYSSMVGEGTDEPARTAPVRPIAPTGNNVEAYRTLRTTDSQMLTLRASTGPLAGLLVHAEWRNQRLGLRLSAPDGTFNARLQRQVEVALSAALGVEVIMEVLHER